MQKLLAPLVIVGLATSATAQTELLYTIERPAQILSAWGDSLTSIEDLDGDGIDDLIVGTFGHAQPIAGSVHSGANGALLYTLDTPFVPLFWGDAIVPITDETGDGLQEIVVIGGHSGDANSPDGRLRVYSGADGSLLREVDSPPGTFLFGHMQGASISLGDVDGDGSDDILVRAAGSILGFTATALSSATGQELYTVAPAAPAALTGDMLTRVSDHDGDGYDDFALVVRESGRTRLQIHSAASGALLETLRPAGLEILTGNGESFLSVTDIDGDGLRDIAIGGVFFGRAALHSSVTGSLLQEWACVTPGEECPGRSIVEVEDFSGDGHPDLLAIESNTIDFENLHLYGVDPLSGEILFEEVSDATGGGYSSSQRVVSMPGVDVQGFPAFAAVADQLNSVQVRRVLPELGSRGCTSVPNSAGTSAALFAFGSPSLALQSLSLSVHGAVPNEPGYFVYGSRQAQAPFGNGFLCVGGQIGRITPISIDELGSATSSVNLNTFAEASTSWTFQALFRDSAVGSFATSDAITIELTR